MDTTGIRGNVGAYVPAQRLQAERAAQAAQSRADRLSSESAQARSEARRLSVRADRLSEQAVQAREEASGVRRRGDASSSVDQVGRALPGEVPQNLRADVPPLTVETPRPSESLPARISTLNLYLSVAGELPAAPAAGRLDVVV